MCKRTYANIDLEAIKHNILEVRNHINKNTKVLAVVKANAYGHGSIPVAEYIKNDVDYFAVATLEEAITLRNNGIKTPVLILGYTFVSEYSELIKYDLTQTIYSVDTAKKLSDMAENMGKKAKIHISVDTGMTRIGFKVDDKGINDAIKACQFSGIIVEGIFTHFSKADEIDNSYSHEQMNKYDYFVEQLQKAGVHIPIRHACNSAGLMKYKDHNYEMVRSGIITYGMLPSEDVDRNILDLRPALEWKAHIINVAEAQEGVKVSYGGTFVTQKPTKIATVSVGYADGYPRSLSNCGEVLIKGKRAKIIGRICMDQMMVDVTEIDDINIEETVTLIGKDGQEHIDIEQLGDISKRFNYEFACDIGNRVERCYK